MDASFGKRFAMPRQRPQDGKDRRRCRYSRLFLAPKSPGREADRLGVEGLLKKIYRAEFHRLYSSVDSSIGSQYDHGHLGPKAAQVSKQFEAIHLRHLDIDESDIVPALFNAQDRIVAISALIYLVVFRLENHCEVVANIAL